MPTHEGERHMLRAAIVPLLTSRRRSVFIDDARYELAADLAPYKIIVMMLQLYRSLVKNRTKEGRKKEDTLF